MKIPEWLKFRFSCYVVCPHRNEIHRPHITCPVCRLRRILNGTLDKTKYDWNKAGHIFVPKNGMVYILTVDNDRRLVRVKAPLLKRLLSICEVLAN